MSPCFNAVCDNVEKLLAGLETDGQLNWDVRYDFLAFHDSQVDGGTVHFYRSVNCNTEKLIDSIYKDHDASPFFTSDLGRLKDALQETPVEGEEMQLLALDVAMDFPWRKSSDCHRVVILLTDEPVETGIQIESQTEKLDALKRKLQDKRIKLFIIAPESGGFYSLAEADRCEYTDLAESCDGLSSVDFSKVLATIGRSVSVSQSYDGGRTEPDPSFDQLDWTSVSGIEWTRD